MSSLATRTAGRVAPPAQRVSRKNVSPVEARRRKIFWPFLAPALLVYAVLFLGPAIASVVISFTRWDGIGTAEPVGIDNYLTLMGDTVFHTAFKNTMVVLLGGGIAVFVLAFGLTMVLREMRGRKFVRSVVFFPTIISPVVLAILWGFIFQANGLMDTGLDQIGIANSPNWLGDHLFLIIVIGLVWTHLGLYVTILMAAVDQIPRYLYEECALAGATAWQRFRYVTLPLTWDVVSAAAVLWTIGSLKIFEFIYAFGGTTADMPPTSVWNSALFIYGNTFGGRTPSFSFGYASAAAVVTVIAVMAFVVLLRRATRRDPIEF
ncbi:carbohydrate ABC transporter membrane protein 1 (CUT1 family) [Zhihengliuella halotolerans]|uniref:Carbohydrate ABC transporter membrane protein 1 (CUT1 family) n=1 Tax=Zhihengliuella halotolerans TaxID=370736 RepID=A0A4V2GA55_9MICC|nr:carbohydrate ABC transporter membrane protein 1 (CUT1 family) [Zhihengliuella halotolerans]